MHSKKSENVLVLNLLVEIINYSKSKILYELTFMNFKRGIRNCLIRIASKPISTDTSFEQLLESGLKFY